MFGSYFSRYVWILSRVSSKKTSSLCFSLIFLTITLSLKHFRKLRNIVCLAEGTEASVIVSCLYQDEVPFPFTNATDTILGTGKMQEVTSVHTLTCLNHLPIFSPGEDEQLGAWNSPLAHSHRIKKQWLGKVWGIIWSNPLNALCHWFYFRASALQSNQVDAEMTGVI